LKRWWGRAADIYQDLEKAQCKQGCFRMTFPIGTGVSQGNAAGKLLFPNIPSSSAAPSNQAIAYYGKLAIHPTPLTALADLWERAAIGPIPGGLVIAAGVLFHGGWAVFALVTLRIEIASRRERRTLIAMG
jgi:hypothetical protein